MQIKIFISYSDALLQFQLCVIANVRIIITPTFLYVEIDSPRKRFPFQND